MGWNYFSICFLFVICGVLNKKTVSGSTTPLSTPTSGPITTSTDADFSNATAGLVTENTTSNENSTAGNSTADFTNVTEVNTTTSVNLTTEFVTFSMTTGVLNTSLACYECEETFDESWDPHTDCQVNPKKTGIRECFSNEIYCMVEKITVLEMTVSIKRKCSEDCWYGCRAKGFGVTQIMCTSCCQDRACNTGNEASTSVSNSSISKIISFFYILLFVQNLF